MNFLKLLVAAHKQYSAADVDKIAVNVEMSNCIFYSHCSFIFEDSPLDCLKRLKILMLSLKLSFKRC